MNSLFRLLVRLLFRFRAFNEAALNTPGPVLLIPNHVSWFDWLFIGVCLDDSWKFVTSATTAEKSWFHRFVMKNRRTFPIDNASPYAVKHMAEFLSKGGKLVRGIFDGETINTPSMLCVEDYFDALRWLNAVGGSWELQGRCRRNLYAVQTWVEKSKWAAFLAEDAATRSCTSICLKVVDPWFTGLDAKEQSAVIKSVTGKLEDDKIAYDIGAYRDAPPGLRIWGGATVETSDIAAMLRSIDVEYTIAERGATKVSLDELLRRSDFVSINCPLDDTSRGMIGAREFGLMQQHAYFITTARGFIHDENALADALRAKKIAGAGLDVWAKEPPPADHPLLQFDNVIASPHTAGVTQEARANMGKFAAEQLITALDGKRPPRIVNPEVWPVYVKRFERAFGIRPEG